MNTPPELLAVCADMPPLVQAHFLATCCLESAAFSRLIENLNYSAEGLRNTWPGRFDAAQAAAYSRQPRRIANRAYANRMGNGDEASGDGFKHRGAGYIMLTGKANQEAFSRARYGDDRIVHTPELLLQPAIAADAARWFWDSRHLSIAAAKDDAVAVRRAVNGGTIGLEHYRELLVTYKNLLGVSP